MPKTNKQDFIFMMIYYRKTERKMPEMNARVIIKDVAQKRWKEQMKNFRSYFNRNEDILFVHNNSNTYNYTTNNEFLEQLDDWNERGLSLTLLQDNTRKFDYKGKTYKMITINGGYKDNEKFDDSDGNTISEMAFALNFLVCGFTYLFKYHSYEEIEDGIKKRLNYVKKKK